MVEAMEAEKGFKKTDIGVIPSDWDAKLLKNVCSMKSGNTITSKNISAFDKYPCYGGNGLRGRTNKFTHSGSFVLIGRQGALCGNINFVDGIFFASEHAIVVTPNVNTNIRWLSYVFVRMNLNQYSESSAQPGLSVQKILELQIAIPPTKAEQTAIATALNDTDALITQLEKLIAKKRAIKQGAMQDLLKPKEGWDLKSVKEIVITPVTDGPHETPLFLQTGIPFLSVNNLVDNKINLSDLRYISQEDHSRYSKKCKPQRNDILLGKAASVGKVSIVEIDLEFNIWSPIALIRPKIDYFPKYIYYSFQTNRIIKQIEFFTNSSTQGNIGMGDIEKIRLSIPRKIEEQVHIATILSDMDAEIETLEKKLDKYKMLKQGMMQNLLTGKIRLI